jgi:DNA-binding transcriptional ArsR family regulator
VKDLKEHFRNMPFRSRAELTDPAVIRAVAHPARMAIIALLGEEASATATECAAVTDESPSSCSYHLRTLAKLGFVEPVPSEDRRQRRWRLIVEGHGIPKRAQDSAEVLDASGLWGQQWVAVEQRALAQFLATEADEPKVWRKAASFSSAEIPLTPDEVLELNERFQALVEPYLDRISDPERRPPRSRRVRVVFTAFPRPT